MKLKRSEIDTIIFDMDGVITKEMTYWQAAALTVYELFYSHRYYGTQDVDRAWCKKRVDQIYQTVFCHGRTVRAIKRLGVNTNWDLAYVVFCVAKYLDPTLSTFEEWHFQSVCLFIENMAVQPPELYVGVEGLLATAVSAEPGSFRRSEGKLWHQLKDCFQAWYHGDDEVEGLKMGEEPLFPLPDIKKTLSALKDAGFRLGVGTGRPMDEIVHPLTMWGLDSYFDADCWTAYDQVAAAEESLKSKEPLAKPHPFVFLKAAFGSEFDDAQIVAGEVPKERCWRVLAVGDAASDLLSAKAGGLRFAAVLTGVEGEAALDYFQKNHADMILDSVLDLKAEDETEIGKKA